MEVLELFLRLLRVLRLAILFSTSAGEKETGEEKTGENVKGDVDEKHPRVLDFDFSSGCDQRSVCAFTFCANNGR